LEFTFPSRGELLLLPGSLRYPEEWQCRFSRAWGLETMPDPARLVHTLQRTVTAFRDTPGRQGRIVRLDADEVLASGDLHGNLDNFRRLLARAALGQHPQRHLVLQEVVHGPFTYPTGEDKSHQLLDVVAALKCQYPRQVHFLPGNHELSQATNRPIGKNDQDLNASFRAGVDLAYGARADEVYALYLELFWAAPLALYTANRVLLTHSLPSASRLERFDPAVLAGDEARAEDIESGGTIHSLVWGRDTRLPTVLAYLEKMDADLLITGHIPTEEGFEVPNERQIILDSQGPQAGYCLFPTDRQLTHAELVGCVALLDG
jgi:hypothetical protein